MDVKFFLILLSASLLSAQSNPSWWRYIPTDSTAVVGIQWKTMKSSLFAPAIAAEMAPGGMLGFPNLEVVRNPEQILIGGPAMLAIEFGVFPKEKLRAQATEQGMRRTTFKGTELWISPEADTHSVAWVNDRLLLIGGVDALEETIARMADPKNRAYSPLLGRGARYVKEDLWVVASELPDPLASMFVPFEIEATGFEGSVSSWNGLHAVASIERRTPTKALDFADSLAETLASRPAMAEGTEITTKDRSVLIRMDLNEEQLASSLRRTPTTATAMAVVATEHAHTAPATFNPPPKARPAAPVTEVSETIPELQPQAPALNIAPSTQMPQAPPRPKTVKILGLDNGPREIPLGK